MGLHHRVWNKSLEQTDKLVIELRGARTEIHVLLGCIESVGGYTFIGAVITG